MCDASSERGARPASAFVPRTVIPATPSPFARPTAELTAASVKCKEQPAAPLKKSPSSSTENAKKVWVS